MEKNYKIAIITALIGDGGKTGELKMSDAARAELDAYGVDIYFVNDNQRDRLLQLREPSIQRNKIIFEGWRDQWMRRYFKWKYPQNQYPTQEANEGRLLAKLPKMCFYHFVPEKYDYYIWLDSKITLEEHWLKYILWNIGRFEYADIILSKHSARGSIKEEFEATDVQLPSIYTKYNKADLAYQVWKYKQSPYFHDDKLYECTMIIYKDTMLNKRKFLEEWYAHNFYLSIQDQLSFPYLLQKHHIVAEQIVHNVFEMPFSHHEYGR